MTGPVDDHTCGEPWLKSAAPCPCWLPHGHKGDHQCEHGFEWER